MCMGVWRTLNLWFCLLEFEDIVSELSVLASRVQDGDTAGQFEWVDSVLVRALKYGHWLFISNANLCRYTKYTVHPESLNVCAILLVHVHVHVHVHT